MIAATKTLHQTYNDIADDYSKSIAILNAAFISFYLKNMPTQKDSVLDLGCGTGEILARLSKHFDHSFGIDPIEKFVAMAKRRASSSIIQVGNAEDLPFKDASIDYIISHVVFQHVDRDRAVQEIVRVLRSGGRLIISEVLSKDIPQNPALILCRRLVFNYFLVSRYGIKQARQAKAYQSSSAWKELTGVHRSRRFDLRQLKDFYSQKLPGAKLKQLDSKIVAVIWDK